MGYPKRGSTSSPRKNSTGGIAFCKTWNLIGSPCRQPFASRPKMTGLSITDIWAMNFYQWIDMGKPWFNEFASGRELKDFRRAGVPTPQARSYLNPSNRAWWMKAVSGLVLALGFRIHRSALAARVVG